MLGLKSKHCIGGLAEEPELDECFIVNPIAT